MKDIWAIRIYLQNAHAVRDLAMFNLAIDSKLRGCDLVSLRVRDVIHGNQVISRAMIVQRKTQRPVQFELTNQRERRYRTGSSNLTCGAISSYFRAGSQIRRMFRRANMRGSCITGTKAVGLDSSAYGTHSMRRTKATLIYKRTKNLRAVQLLLGHSKAGKHRQIPRHRDG